MPYMNSGIVVHAQNAEASPGPTEAYTQKSKSTSICRCVSLTLKNLIEMSPFGLHGHLRFQTD